MKNKEIYIGDKDSFALRYVPGYTYIDKDGHKSYYAYCHLVLAGQIIGSPTECCYIKSWILLFEAIKEKIQKNTNSKNHPAFLNRSDREIFEIILKSNQIEEDYNEAFAYLPVLEKSVWYNCAVSIDETTDAYLITMIECDEKIKFIWEGWRGPCPADRIGKLFSVTVDRKFVIDTMEHCLNIIKNEYRNYPIGLS